MSFRRLSLWWKAVHEPTAITSKIRKCLCFSLTILVHTCLFASALSLCWPLKKKNRTLLIETGLSCVPIYGPGWPCWHVARFHRSYHWAQLTARRGLPGFRWPERKVCVCVCVCVPMPRRFDQVFLDVKEKKLWAKTQWARLRGINSARSSLRQCFEVWTCVNLVPELSSHAHPRAATPAAPSAPGHLFAPLPWRPTAWSIEWASQRILSIVHLWSSFLAAASACRNLETPGITSSVEGCPDESF